MIKKAKQNSKRLLLLCGLALALMSPTFATPTYACGGASTGAGYCGG